MYEYDTNVQFVKGVGEKLAGLLSKRDIYTIKDLLEYYPRAYEDRRKARDIRSLEEGELVSLVARIRNVSTQQMGRSRRKIYTVSVQDESGIISCKYFRAPYRGYFERLKTGTKVRVIGKTTSFRGRIEFHHPDIKDYDPSEDDNSVVPVYVESERLSSRKIRSIIQNAYQKLEVTEEDYLPDWLQKKYDLEKQSVALKNVHFPPLDIKDDYIHFSSASHRRLKFDEFFLLELYLAAKKSGIKREKGIKITLDYDLLEKVKSQLPFELTNAQKRCLNEILRDVSDGNPMHRLVQGDVGSGKTMVALLSGIMMAASGYQTALMVPTEILASQHYKNAKALLEPLGYKVGYLTGMQKAKDKRENLALVESGEYDFVVGTHALIQEQVVFKKLGLVIVDEQHRFGVDQRNQLKQKGISPHFLVMTATPIPRTLAMTVYGDLDVSVIDELPKGRIPILTKVVFENKRRSVLDFMAKQAEEGRQAYIVYPLVEESEKMDLKNAVDEYENLKQEYPEIKFGLLHGKMKEAEKAEIMEQFRQNTLQVLVSTTVIEVGVDVPNANMMIIEHTERFGLSQLHQLRGRVGRGKYKSYCVLMLAYASGEESKYRANVMASTNDGFRVAEEDMKIRGPGEIMGRRQSGLAGFKLASLVEDMDILMMAREAAFEIFKKDPHLKLAEHQKLRDLLLQKHGPTALAGVG